MHTHRLSTLPRLSDRLKIAALLTADLSYVALWGAFAFLSYVFAEQPGKVQAGILIGVVFGLPLVSLTGVLLGRILSAVTTRPAFVVSGIIVSAVLGAIITFTVALPVVDFAYGALALPVEGLLVAELVCSLPVTIAAGGVFSLIARFLRS